MRRLALNNCATGEKGSKKKKIGEKRRKKRVGIRTMEEREEKEGKRKMGRRRCRGKRKGEKETKTKTKRKEHKKDYEGATLLSLDIFFF